ncbi:MAG: hypothetical protein ACTHU0_10355 [Kofleriaceae bacterium]
MNFLNRNVVPSYKGAQPQGTSGPLAGLFENLFGGKTPSYKTVDGRGANAQRSFPSWWQALSPRPSYRTAPAAAEQPAHVAHDPDASPAECGPEVEGTCVCAPEDATQIVILE